MVELIVANEKELADHFLQKYKEASKDKDLESIFLPTKPIVLKHGVLTCEERSLCRTKASDQSPSNTSTSLPVFQEPSIRPNLKGMTYRKTFASKFVK